MPEPPSLHALLAIALTFVAILLFTREKVPLEGSSFFILILILVWFEFFPTELAGERLRAGDVVAGFGNEALITIMTLMMLARGVERTGALQPLSHALARLWSVRPNAALLATLLTAATVSMFMNNTPVVALVLPLLVAVSVRSGVMPSRILMPVGFATIIGGSATTIGTSTNLLITSIAADLGMREMQMFDFALPEFIVGGIGLLYLWLVAPKLVPDRRPPMMDVELRIFDSVLRINEGSFADGKTLSEVLGHTNGQMKVSRIARGELTLVKLPSAMIRAGDLLHVRDSPERLKEHEQLLGATLLPTAPGQEGAGGRSLQSTDHLAEIVVTRGSELDDNTLDATRQLSVYNLMPLALHRPGQPSQRSAGDLQSVRLGAGDVVLVQGATSALERLHRSGKLLVLDGRLHLPRTGRAAVAAAIMVGVVSLAAFELAPISLAALSGLLLMIVTRCMTWRDALHALDRRIVMVVVASLALGLALMATGAAAWIASL